MTTSDKTAIILCMTTQYVHQAHYGNAGGLHTAKPQFTVHGNTVYGSQYNTSVPAGKAIFEIHDNKWYATEYHPGGKSAHALYETRGDKIHTTTFHPEHNPSEHVFELSTHEHRS